MFFLAGRLVGFANRFPKNSTATQSFENGGKRLAVFVFLGGAYPVVTISVYLLELVADSTRLLEPTYLPACTFLMVPTY